MEVFYDGAIYSIQRFGGINRYFANLYAHLPDSIQRNLVTIETPELASPKLNIFRPEVSPWMRWNKMLRRRSEASQVRKTIRRSGPAIIHPTYYRFLSRDHYEVRNRGNGRRLPVVLTVYDFIHEKFREQIRHSERQIAWKKQAIERADAIICISKSTMDDLGEYYGRAADKACVIYLANDLKPALEDNSARVKEAHGRYFLYVGSRNTYKNFGLLLAASKHLADTGEEFRVICVGPEFTESELAQIHELKLNRSIIHAGKVDDETLIQLYQNSLAFVYPSLYEGFGIPLLEAMACSTPVIASDRSSFPEIVGENGLLFDPDCKESLAAAMSKLLDDEFLRVELVEKGRQRARQFSWEATASQTADVYRRVA